MPSGFNKLAATAIAVVLAAMIMPARAQSQTKPVPGFAVGPKMDEISPKRFIVDPPTIENLGFRWYVEGDSNRNASVAVAFRKKGGGEWKKALPMLRVHHEVSDQKYGPWRTGNRPPSRARWWLWPRAFSCRRSAGRRG